MDLAVLDEQHNRQQVDPAEAKRLPNPSAAGDISSLNNPMGGPDTELGVQRKKKSRALQKQGKSRNGPKETTQLLSAQAININGTAEPEGLSTKSKSNKRSHADRLASPEESVAASEAVVEEGQDEARNKSKKGKKAKSGKKTKNWLRVASLVHRNGFLVETVYKPDKNPPLGFKMHQGKSRKFGSTINFGITPIAPPVSNGMVEKGTILLPSDAAPYGSQKQLVREIKVFIHRYADVSDFWEEIIAHYLLMTWVYDRFSALPYLRFISEPGTGKSRLLQICTQLSYKGISASGAITASPLFRLMDVWGGTLVIDEADFKNSEGWVDIIKVLNTGYMKGVPVIRSEKVGQTYEPRAFDAFGPKIIANRSRFGDPALESRCITLEGEEHKLRDDIPRQLPPQFFDEALRLRNKLLQWRFDNFDRIKVDESKLLHLEPRLAQIGTPIYSVSDDPEFQKRFLHFLTERGAEERSERPQAVVVEAIKALVDVDNFGLTPRDDLLTVKRVADRTNEIIRGNEMAEEMTAKRVGSIVRSLGFTPKKKVKGYTFPVNAKRLAELVEKYLSNTREHI